MRRHIICDVDHTLTNAFWRDGMLANRPVDWDEYHAASIHDKPALDVVEMVQALHLRGFLIVGITGRPEKWRKLTVEWMIKHKVPMDELHMRPNDNYDTAGPLKLFLARLRFSNIPEQVAMVIDDHDGVIAAFTALGVTCLQTHGRRE